MSKRQPLTKEHKAKIGRGIRRAKRLKRKSPKRTYNKKNNSLINQLKAHRNSVDNTIRSLENLGVK